MRCFTNGQNKKQEARTKSPLAVFSLSFLVSCISVIPLAACPLCKEALEKVSGLGQGFYWSILLMLGIPLLIVGVVSGVIIRAHRRYRLLAALPKHEKPA
jgi:O-antigen/teichoic acid export membrane protein